MADPDESAIAVGIEWVVNTTSTSAGPRPCRAAPASAARVPSTNGSMKPGRSKYGATLSISTSPTRSVPCRAFPKSSRYWRHDEYDEYADVADPVLDPEPTVGYLSNDLVDIASALTHGLSHHDAGRPVEALWWWQFSYLSHWGERAASALRVVQALLAHVRLDADPDVVSEAEFDALHP